MGMVRVRRVRWAGSGNDAKCVQGTSMMLCCSCIVSLGGSLRASGGWVCSSVEFTEHMVKIAMRKACTMRARRRTLLHNSMKVSAPARASLRPPPCCCRPLHP